MKTISASRWARLALAGVLLLCVARGFVGAEHTDLLGTPQSPLSYLDERGPGGRTGPLTQTKKPRPPIALLAQVPLSDPPRASAPPSAFLAELPAGPVGGGPEAFPLVVGGPAPDAPVIDGFVPSSLPPLDPPQPGANPSSTDVPVVPGVPEPASWLLDIIGVGAIGIALRRRRPAAVFAA